MHRIVVFSKYQPVNCKIDIHPFVLGIARLFDLAGYLDHPGKKTRKKIDKESLQNDLISISEDFKTVIEKAPPDVEK